MRRILIALALFGGCAAVPAATYTFTVTSTLAFPSANPSTTPLIPGNAPVVAQILVTNPSKQTFRIMVQAQGANLSSGTDTIPVGNLTWTATATYMTTCSKPPCNVQGTPSIAATSGTQTLTTSPVNSATGNDGQATTATDTYTGTITHNFNLANSWFYTTGSYTQSLLFTFASP